MKNYEKYADKIKEYNGDDICTDFIEPYILKSINAKCNNTNCLKCHLYRIIWLMEDYEESGVDWSKVKVDTPILVRDDECEEWERRYFAKFEDSTIYAWSDGRTSWTGEGQMTIWNYVKLAESKDE